METPESLVYRGVEGTGAAQIFGREGNPMRAVMQRQADIHRKEAIAAEQAKLKKQERDKRLWEMINVDPESAYEPFNKQVVDAADGHRKKIADYFERGGDPEDPQFQVWAKKGWDNVNNIARRSNYIKDSIKETRDLISKNPYLRAEYYHPKINDLYMDEEGNALPIDQIDVESIRGIYETDPLGFNEQKYQKDFMDGLNDNMTNYVRQKAQNNGILTEDVETKWKGNLYTPDESSSTGVKTDEQGNPILNITPDFINSFTNSDTAKRYYQSIAEQQGIPVSEVIRQKVSNQGGGLQQNVRSSFSRNPSSMENLWMKQQQRQIGATDRVTKLNHILSGVSDTGEITPEARAALGAFKNAKMLDGNVVDIDIIPGTNTPGTTDFYGRRITNNPSNRLVMTVKVADRGQPKLIEINLDDEGAFESLNGLFNNSPAETTKYSTNDLTQLTGFNLSDRLSSNKNEAVTKEAKAKLENETVSKIMNSQVDENIDDLVGFVVDGKKVEAARKVVTESGWSPGIFGKPWGQKEGIELEFTKPDGNKEYKYLNSEEEVRNLLKGKSGTKDDMVSVIGPNGQKGSMKKSDYEKYKDKGFKLVK